MSTTSTSTTLRISQMQSTTAPRHVGPAVGGHTREVVVRRDTLSLIQAYIFNILLAVFEGVGETLQTTDRHLLDGRDHGRGTPSPSSASSSASASGSAPTSPSASPPLSSKVPSFIPPHVLARRPSIPGPITKKFAAQRDPESRDGGSEAASLAMPSTSAFSERERIHVLASDPDVVVVEDDTGVGSVVVSSVSMTTTFITNKLYGVFTIPYRCVTLVRDLVGGLALGRAAPPLPSTASTPPIASFHPKAKDKILNDAEPLVASPTPISTDLSHTLSARERIQVLAPDPDVSDVEDAVVGLVAVSAVTDVGSTCALIYEPLRTQPTPQRFLYHQQGLHHTSNPSPLRLSRARPRRRTRPRTRRAIGPVDRGDAADSERQTHREGEELRRRRAARSVPEPRPRVPRLVLAPPPADLSQVGSSSYGELFGVPGMESEPHGAGASASGEVDRPLTSGPNVEEGVAADADKRRPLSDEEFYASLPRPAAAVFRSVDGA
ncbi:hypothetical protein BDK51DRAFT_47312 [Blyttiomyces helicus]|uniref:Uncharacterized protein n=1 Tax=Blyttiomyces helicus TaxID=388810 RepID=A0A4P9W1S6_9FUNG|nr:hypothetical protein BDK51DRAFT_47312 [Blyttiomyces helicus]|eukprot:RKO86064.1 hypothetical protein BDK51DRAFT_47312 [Blyttiomyces helicus]